MKNIYSIIAFLVAANTVQSQSYTPVDAGSKVHFVIKNFGIKTGGDFTGLKGTIVFNPKALAASHFNVTVNAGTVDTDNRTRDKHLRKSDYFDVEKFPLISFVSTKITESTNAGRFYVFGNLTIKGVTKAVEFGFSATPVDNGYLLKGGFEINRRDYGVGGSSFSLSDNLTITLTVTAKE
jgi:polyisoprenoid-binding protein YceI